MTRYLTALLIALAATGTWAADAAETLPGESNTPANRDDVDVLFLQGVALDLLATRDTDKFERNITRVGAMVDYKSTYDFTAIGASSNEFRQDDWSLRVNSVLASVRKVNRATAEGFTARAEVAFKGDERQLHGEGNWNIRFSASTGVELIANRDAIETQRALTNGTMANFFAASFDHALSERLTVIGMPTYRHFSDGNEQAGLRGWLIYALIPERGLSLNVKARGYESSQNGGGAYFSPERYERAEIGLRLRRSMGDWRVFATADLGRERINRDIEKPTSQLALTAQRSFANNTGLGLQFAYYRASDSANNTASETERYAWRMARLFVTIPF
jgi:hypothetical protein